MISRSILATALLALAHLSPASAASRDDIHKIVAQMGQHTCKHLLTQKSYPGGGEQVVFVDGGKRYTMYWSESGVPKEAWLSVWVRSSGRKRNSVLKTFSDYGLDGEVDFGLMGPAKWSDEKRQYFGSGKFAAMRPQGRKFRQRWQNEYDAAIAAAKRRLL